ncbi:MAG: sulfatase-like hydrolase/transferase [Helicobacteraceae bacterium]|jgi:membrane-anchored protein YejM (alkaline phosphatase superfamily)|nr:sulfatase-like hydrolase/transferase [Helicobacteraceae bacterium]
MNARLSLFAKANLLFIAVLLSAFLLLAVGFSAVSLCVSTLAALSTALMFFVALWLFCALFGVFRRVSFIFAGALFTIFELLAIADFFIYRIYYTHINAMILNIAFSPAALKNIDLGVYPYILLAALAALIVAFQCLLYYALPHEKKSKKINAAINRFLIPIAVLVVLSDKLIVGFATLYSKTEILDKLRVIPYYQPLSFTRFAKEYFGVDPAPNSAALEGQISSQKTNALSQLDYPKNPLVFGETYEGENIIIIMLDAVRWDMIDDETAPAMNALKNESIVFNNHFSGGNATRFGVFSFFYGLNAPYWFAFLNAQRHSVLFDALEYRGFNAQIFAASDLNWPEFRRTAFASINDKIIDNFEGEAWQKDAQMNERVLSWLDQNLSEPFFTYIFYDAPHQSSYPPTHNKFQPDDEGDKNYLTLGASQRDVLFNQYKNAIYYDDSLIAELIAKLKAIGVYERAKIIVTADHGEEFYESGGFGHNHSFSIQQTKPMFFMRLPNTETRQIDYLTSHADFIPTVMRWLGVQNPPEDYANGYDLLYPQKRRDYAVIGNWNFNAIVENNHTLVFSAHPDPINGARVFGANSYKPLPNSILSDHSQSVLRVMNENKRFYK